MSRQRWPQRGTTMIELMVAVTILGLLAMMAVPSMRDVLQNSRSASISTEFVAGLNFARSEAVKRRAVVTICTSADGVTCRASGAVDYKNWEKGWVMLDAANAVLRRGDTLTATAMLCGSTGQIQFTGTGGTINSITPNFTLTLPGCRGENLRIIAIGVTGRISVSRSACPTVDPTCV